MTVSNYENTCKRISVRLRLLYYHIHSPILPPFRQHDLLIDLRLRVKVSAHIG